jgi:superfamily II DNA helicase RecQ
MSSYLPVTDEQGVTAEPARRITEFGLTDRHARFLITVMLHSGVFVGRQYAAFARITHGQKVHDFIERLLVRRFVTPIELGSTGRTRIFHVHHKPLYSAIGEPDNRNRRRVIIDRAIERLMVLDGVLASWRLDEARRNSIAPFVVLHDRTLLAIASTLPQSSDDLLAIPGIGPAKLATYGDAILSIVATTITSAEKA